MNEDIYVNKDHLKEYVNMMTKMWTDFAKTGNPTPDNSWGVKWIPYTSRRKEYLNIDNKVEMAKDGEKERVDFWTKMYNEAGVPVDVKSNL
ncbi:jg13985 [Pararge aegeria aegeria]|uniref:Jg13985 protein n=1 Tax=Pararge aegeria aegeria TaxID=348720 RepID=A0A8S4R8A0_9NEOP|nr:jg13985 [Pararge aegeria aegeria]